MSSAEFEVKVTIREEEGYFSARAQVIWLDGERRIRVPDTCTKWCQSRSSGRAASYALTEIALLVEQRIVGVSLA